MFKLNLEIAKKNLYSRYFKKTTTYKNRLSIEKWIENC